MKKYLIGQGESRVVINKPQLNIKGYFDILVLKDSKCCQIDDIKANEIYLFNSDLSIVSRNVINKIFCCSGSCTISGNTSTKIEISGNNNLITGNISKVYKNGN